MASIKKQKRIGIIVSFCVIVTVIAAACVYYVYLKTHSDKEMYRNSGISAMNNGSYGIAVNDFDMSLQEEQWFCEEMDLDTKMYKGTCLMRLGRYEEAYKLFTALSKESSPAVNQSAVISMLEIADANMLVNKVTGEGAAPPDDDTITRLKEAAVKDTGMYLYLASAHNRRQEYEAEMEDLNNYLASHPMNTYVAYELSTAYLKNGNIEEAERIINEGLNAADEVYKDMLNYNLVICREYSGEYDAAFELIKSLYEQYPKNEDIAREYTFLNSRVNPDTKPVNPFSDAL